MILNLTQHKGAPDQGVTDIIDPDSRTVLTSLLTFEEMPSYHEIYIRATDLAALACAFTKPGDRVMIGGAPYLMGQLEQSLIRSGRIPTYAFSKRISKEDPKNGQKTSIFKHEGFIDAV